MDFICSAITFRLFGRHWLRLRFFIRFIYTGTSIYTLCVSYISPIKKKQKTKKTRKKKQRYDVRLQESSLSLLLIQYKNGNAQMPRTWTWTHESSNDDDDDDFASFFFLFYLYLILMFECMPSDSFLLFVCLVNERARGSDEIYEIVWLRLQWGRAVKHNHISCCVCFMFFFFQRHFCRVLEFTRMMWWIDVAINLITARQLRLRNQLNGVGEPEGRKFRN